MKKIILLFLLIQQIAICQSENSTFPAKPYSTLSELAVEGDYIYTAGNCNTALVSADAGLAWSIVGIQDSPRNIKILPGSNGTKAIYQYNDLISVFDFNTMEFEEISSSSLFFSSGNYTSIEVDDEHIYVMSNQNVHKAIIGEYDWTKVADFNFDNDAVVATDITQNYLHIGTLNGLFVRVDLNTETTETMNNFMNRISTFDMITDDLGYFTIQNYPHPIKTTTGGLTHTELDNFPENIGITGFGDNIIMTVNTNRIYVSTDGGQSTTHIPIPDDGTYDLIYSSFVSEDGVVYFSGRSSMVIKTEDYGNSFINLNEYKRENLIDIEVHPTGTGVAVGGLSTIIKTADGGENWAILDLPVQGEGDNYLNSAVVISNNKYLIAGSNTLSIVENDEVTTTIPRGIDALLYNEENNYLIGLQSSNSDYSIIKSTDQGLTWESKAFLPGYSYHISQSPSGKIYVPGLDGVIYTSIDGGDTWEIDSFGADLEIRNIVFYDENIGLGSTGSNLYKTTDGGETTTNIASGYLISNMKFISEDQIIYTTASNSKTNVYESKDGGSSFQKTKEYCSASQGSSLDKNGAIWFAQKGGHINKFEVESPNNAFDLNADLISIYPNPISQGQDITFDIDNQITAISLTSISGKTIRKSTVNFSNTISSEGLNPGMYTVSIQTQNGETKHGKLIVLK